MTVCAFAVFLALTRTLIAPASADLTALWLAGQFLAEGRPDLVYPADATLFTMLPPPEWFARQAAAGQPGDVFPYLYPPLWAALAANLSPHASLVAVLAVAGWINPALLAGCFILAWRIAGRPLRPDIWLAAGLTFAMFTSVGLIAIGQDQPQILVAFLTLLALERAESGAPHAAGAALALAAAIKLFPALLVIFWLGRDRRAALAAFAVAGAALALLSVALAGWPLHRDFLRIIRAVSATGLVTNLSYSLDATLGQLAYTDRIAFIRSPARDPALGDRAGWNVYAKPAALGLALLAAQIATLALAARALARAAGPATRAAIMAAALTFATLLGPVGWSYYYIAPAAFLPLLLTRFGALSGLAVMVLIALPVCVAMSILNPALPGILRPLQLFGVVAMMVMGAAFLSLARRTRG
jgi:hypothetical protein